MDGSGCIMSRSQQGCSSTAGNGVGPPQEAQLPAHPLLSGWSSTLDKQPFHFSHFLGFLWRGLHGTTFPELIRKRSV